MEDEPFEEWSAFWPGARFIGRVHPDADIEEEVVIQAGATIDLTDGLSICGATVIGPNAILSGFLTIDKSTVDGTVTGGNITDSDVDTGAHVSGGHVERSIIHNGARVTNGDLQDSIVWGGSYVTGGHNYHAVNIFPRRNGVRLVPRIIAETEMAFLTRRSREEIATRVDDETWFMTDVERVQYYERTGLPPVLGSPLSVELLNSPITPEPGAVGTVWPFLWPYSLVLEDPRRNTGIETAEVDVVSPQQDARSDISPGTAADGYFDFDPDAFPPGPSDPDLMERHFVDPSESTENYPQPTADPSTAQRTAERPSPSSIAEPRTNPSPTLTNSPVRIRDEVYDSHPPEELIDGIITYQMIHDAVITPSGYTYDQSAIMEWLEHSGQDPVTRGGLEAWQLIPNRLVQMMIDRWKANHRVRRGLSLGWYQALNGDLILE